jgi:hypothetical protein
MIPMNSEVNAGAESAEASACAGEIGNEAGSAELPTVTETFGRRGESSAQKSAEQINEAVRAHNLEKYGEIMSAERRDALERYDSSEKIEVCSREAYNRAYPSGSAGDFRVVGHCEADGKIVIKDVDPAMTRHISTHESTHLCAEKPVGFYESGFSRRSGVFECNVCFNEGGECVSFTETGRGINEGLTELYALRELEAQGDTEAYDSMSSYLEASHHAERLEIAIGSERVEKAYFGEEKEALVRDFDRMCGENGAWEQYAEDIDTITYSENAAAVAEANLRINGRYFDILKYDREGRQSGYDEL